MTRYCNYVLRVGEKLCKIDYFVDISALVGFILQPRAEAVSLKPVWLWGIDA